VQLFSCEELEPPAHSQLPPETKLLSFRRLPPRAPKFELKARKEQEEKKNKIIDFIILFILFVILNKLTRGGAPEGK
jgi:hypothetical protein